MGLSGLDIYKLLPKTNCKECGFATCLAFAMQLAQKKIALDKCPYVSEDSKKALDSASEPPIKLITMGTGDRKVEIGNGTVMFRHEEKFHHPTAIGFLLEDTETEGNIKKAAAEIKKFEFERVGQKIGVNLVALKGSSGKEDSFLALVKTVMANCDLGLVLLNDNPAVLKKALEVAKDKKPLIGMCRESNLKEMTEAALSYRVPLIVESDSLDGLAGLVKKVNDTGLKDLVLYTGEKGLSAKIWDMTILRKMAIKKTFRPFGYPALVFAASGDVYEEAAFTATFVAKYAGICIIKNRVPYEVLSILTARQNIFTDPQKPLQVEAKIYEIGNPNDKSPVIVTTNFSLTYYTVESEVESSKVPAYIIACDAEGMSVLTAWAAEKFTAESVSKVLKESGIAEKVSHKNVIIPGYVAVLSAKIQDEAGWTVTVGPREASGIPTFLRNLSK